MNWQQRLRQIWLVARLEQRRAFFSRRAFWVYLLALFPTIPFAGRGIEARYQMETWKSQAVSSPAALDSVQEGEAAEDVITRLGAPIRDFSRVIPQPENPPDTMRHLLYFDGHRRADLTFRNGGLDRIRIRPLVDLEEDRQIFARIFHQFYLRLAVFFGCLGICMNLFRGEMLDKTLHYWFLAPIRREVLLAGKYLAGVTAAGVIFGAGALLCYGAMLWPQSPAQLEPYWNQHGLAHAAGYMAAAVLGCVGYGSVFLAAGILVRNPIIPAAILLVWESINGFLPAMLQQLSVLHHLQALAPVAPPVDSRAPAILQLFLAPAQPPAAWVAVLGLLAVTALVLWVAARSIRKVEINYGAE